MLELWFWLDTECGYCCEESRQTFTWVTLEGVLILNYVKFPKFYTPVRSKTLLPQTWFNSLQSVLLYEHFI